MLPKIIDTERTLAEQLWYTPASIPKKYREAYQAWLFHRQMKKESLMKQFITDCPSPVNLAYTYDASKKLFHELYTQTQEQIEKFWQPYDKIIYVPIEFEVEQDGERHIEEKYRKEIDERVVQIAWLLWMEIHQVDWDRFERIRKSEVILKSIV